MVLWRHSLPTERTTATLRISRGFTHTHTRDTRIRIHPSCISLFASYASLYANGRKIQTISRRSCGCFYFLNNGEIRATCRMYFRRRIPASAPRIFVHRFFLFHPSCYSCVPFYIRFTSYLRFSCFFISHIFFHHCNINFYAR